jgi:hypothetical protein
MLRCFNINGGSFEINLQGVSKKGQILWGQLSNPNELRDINLNQIKRIKLHFPGKLTC